MTESSAGMPTVIQDIVGTSFDNIKSAHVQNMVDLSAKLIQIALALCEFETCLKINSIDDNMNVSEIVVFVECIVALIV